MHVSTRALGAGAGDAGGAAGAIVEYLESGVAAKSGGRPGQTMSAEPAGADGYYADSSETPGQWVGRGVGNVRLTGPVEREAFTRVLLGRDPHTGEQLVGAAGSAGRVDLAGRGGGSAGGGAWLSVAETADVLNVRPSYVRRLLARGADDDARQTTEGRLPSAELLGNRDEQGRWRVARSEVERFAAARRKPTVVVGYDVTFSAPKSVSVLWAVLDGPERAEVVASVDAAVAAGVAYLEDHAAFIRVQGRRVRSDGLVAASYLHGTSRALDPQLHRHVVIANMGSAGGRVQALDGTQIHLHQRTAAALAGAELRRQLSVRLGVQWSVPRRAKADILGVPTTVLRAMSTRSAEINELVAEMGNDTLAARQVAAYQTRAAKQAVAADGLRAGWQSRLAALGFDVTAAERCLGTPTPEAGLSGEGRAELHAALGRLVTEDAACFDRRDVIAHVADWAGNRLNAAEVIDAADGWLATDLVVRVGTPPGWRAAKDGIRRADGRRVHAATGAPLYTTTEMLELEQRVRVAVAGGRDAGAGVAAIETVERVLAGVPTLGADQADLVRALTTSGHRVQAAVGPAGTGKTFALTAAARAWEADGLRVLGAAVGGTAAEVLGRTTGIPSTTIASLLARLDLAHPTDPVLDARTVVVVDEASTLGNRELDRLVRHVERAGATLRLVGDPAQHSAVPAGGLWRVLTAEQPATPRLSVLRRQRGEAMSDVRAALEEYRGGEVHAAVDRLRAAGRVVAADSPEEVLDRLVADWYADRQHRRKHPDAAPSSMVAEHHHERAELTRRARALLSSDGSLTGPSLVVEDTEFRVGDEVIARLQDRRLRPAGGNRASFVRNGSRGVVREVLHADSAAPSLLVDFDQRGLVVVPWRYLTEEVRPGVRGGLAHSYALTSHAAQGETYDAARHLATERSTRAGVYVGLSRGTSDARLYVARANTIDPDARPDHGLPTPPPDGNDIDALLRRLNVDDSERLPTELDPDITEVVAVARRHDLRQLLALADHDELAGRAAEMKANTIAAQACASPSVTVVADLGSRPSREPERAQWDRAVGALAVYRAVSDQPDAADLGARPTDPDAARLYDRAAYALHRARPAAPELVADRGPGLELT